MSTLMNKTIKGLFWSGIDTFFSKGLSFVFNLLIARQLSPDDYGVVAILAVIMAICQCFVDSGFGASLVRKSKCSETDFSTVFIFNIVVALLFYFLLYLGTPILASFYALPQLTELAKIYSIILIINSLAIVQSAKLTIEVNFKAFAKVSVVSAIISGITALVMAYKGYGIWSLVFQSVVNASTRTILLWIIGKWRPLAKFSCHSLKEHLTFGSKLLGSSLINTIYNNIYTLVIGKAYSPKSLGAYNKGESIIKFPSETLTTAIGNVIYPILSSIKNNEARSYDAFRQLTKMSTFIIFPMVLGVGAIADPFIRICLTDKWEMAIPVMKILCFSLLWAPVTSMDLTIIKAFGRSDFFLRITVITKAINLLILVVTIPFGLLSMCLGQVVATLIHLLIDSVYTKKTFNYGLKDKITDCGVNFIIAALMFVFVLLVESGIPNPSWKLIVGIPSGVIFYIAMAKILRIKELHKLTELIKSLHK